MDRCRTVTWDDPLETAAMLRELSGLEAVQAMLSGRIPPPPIAKLLGFSFGKVEPGLVEVTLPVGEHLYNPLGMVHGGATATLLDTVMGCAVQSMLPRGQRYTTLELKISYLSPITLALGTVTAQGRILKAGRKAAFAEGRIVDPQGKVLATGSTTCAVFEA